MEIPSKYNPAEAEAKWYQYWLDNGCFKSVPDDRQPFTIVIPPPNVTGVLHMGHMLNNTIQDVLVRRARLLGKNACWVPGTDHASIATEAKVVAKLKEEGIDKSQLTREAFLEHAWDWTNKHGGIILEQLKKLGASCDWDRTAFTLDEVRSDAVTRSFVDLFRRGLIYRGYRMVNWDPVARTTVSDEEVIHKEVQGKLYYIKYFLANGDGYIPVATTRPETIFGDVALCMNPKDKRYRPLLGKTAYVPLINREIPIIGDSYVDKDFGTGFLKITPAHDINDKEIGDRHGLEIIECLDERGCLNEHGMHYQGMDRFEARKKIVKELEEIGMIDHVEDHKISVGTSERTGAVIEPRLSMQWFMRMKEPSKPALQAVMQGVIEIVPDKFVNTYRHWLENVRDWCISRQLWWGHQIPVWYYGDGKDDFVVAHDLEEALSLARVATGKVLLTEDLRQDPDALDTWFSSWLWPISVFDGFRNPNNPEIKYYYPTQVLVTAPEILFFWVARMIMAGYLFRERKPFERVYLTGIVRDKQGRKMSKSLGNSPDPIELIGKYGADGVRVGMLLTSPAGNDLPFDEDLCLQGRNFTNKVWNAFRLIQGFKADKRPQPEASKAAIGWFEGRLNHAILQLNQSFDKLRISEALMITYKLIWDDFCSWYLEMIKEPVLDSITLERTQGFLEQLVVILHPFTPFLTEEIWQYLSQRNEGETIMTQPWPKALSEPVAETESQFQFLTATVTELRNFRASRQMSPKVSLELFIKDAPILTTGFGDLLKKLANIEVLHQSVEASGTGHAFVVGGASCFVPLEEHVDVGETINKLQEELDYFTGFLKMVEKKLSNDRFVSSAPEKVVAMERKKQADAQVRISAIEQQLAGLRSQIN
jgi:valyl-tRNA synthetase